MKKLLAILLVTISFACTIEPVFADDGRKPKAGWIYIIVNPDSFCVDSMTKIGLTTQNPPTKRVDTHNTSVPFEYTILGWVYTCDVYYTEGAIHDILRDYRANPRREFFDVDFNIIIEKVEELGYDIYEKYYHAEQTLDCNG